MSVRMLEIYIQEVAVDTFWNLLPIAIQQKIESFATSFPELLARCASSARGNTA